MDRGLGLHGSYVTTVGDYSAAAAQVILPHVIGSLEVYEQQTSLPLVIENTQTIVLVGLRSYQESADRVPGSRSRCVWLLAAD